MFSAGAEGVEVVLHSDDEAEAVAARSEAARGCPTRRAAAAEAATWRVRGSDGSAAAATAPPPSSRMPLQGSLAAAAAKQEEGSAAAAIAPPPYAPMPFHGSLGGEWLRRRLALDAQVEREVAKVMEREERKKMEKADRKRRWQDAIGDERRRRATGNDSMPSELD